MQMASWKSYASSRDRQGAKTPPAQLAIRLQGASYQTRAGLHRSLVSRKGAKTQSQDQRFSLPSIHLRAFAPWREVNAINAYPLKVHGT
jgi:hypothetical protein